MSYCRFSSCNWRSDVYAYEDVRGGYTIHVAANRLVIRPIPVPAFLFGGLARVVMKFAGSHFCNSWVGERVNCAYFRFATLLVALHDYSRSLIPIRKIGGAFDGQTIETETASDCVEQLLMLRGEGYFVPQFAIDRLLEEQ